MHTDSLAPVTFKNSVRSSSSDQLVVSRALDEFDACIVTVATVEEMREKTGLLNCPLR